MRASHLDALIASNEPAICIRVADAKGSTPRESGAWMIVTELMTSGTIGGGTLEFRAIARAREMLAAGQTADERMEIPLGPEIGQCCGGRVALALTVTDRERMTVLRDELLQRESVQPAVLVFGGGHVGNALARALAALPFNTLMVETRGDVLPDDLPVPSKIVAMPEVLVTQAEAGSAIVVLTHDHALDFMIVSEALKRDDLPYIGMIGSKTKRATFQSQWLREGGISEDLDKLISPIGGDTVRDKRPDVIAALVAAEITTVLLGAE